MEPCCFQPSKNLKSWVFFNQIPGVSKTNSTLAVVFQGGLSGRIERAPGDVFPHRCPWSEALGPARPSPGRTFARRRRTCVEGVLGALGLGDNRWCRWIVFGELDWSNCC